jgi:hypothetical protein
MVADRRPSLGSNSLRLVATEIRRRSAARFFLVVEIAELLAASVLHDEGGAGVLDRPGRREAAKLT